MPIPQTRPLRNYPVPQPESGDDPRFSFGLLVDVAHRIEAAGFPPIDSGRDLVRLSQALYRFCYSMDER